jgi:uncharacterized protein
MSRCVQLLLFLIVPACTLLAQAPDSAATREDVLKLFDIMHVHDQMRLIVDATIKQQRSVMHDMMKRQFPRTTEEELAHLDELMDNMVKDMPLDDMLNDMIPIYQKHLSRGDVDAMSVFYSTPTGQKLLREMPAMASESMQASYPRMQAMTDKIATRAQQMAKEEQEKKEKQEKKALPAKPEAPKN